MYDCAENQSLGNVEQNGGPKLMDRPLSRDRNAENSAYAIRFNNWTKCLIAVDTLLLTASVCYKSGLVAKEGAINIKLMVKQPYRLDNTNLNGSQNKCPSPIGDKCIVLVVYGLTPVYNGLDNPTLKMSVHVMNRRRGRSGLSGW